MSMEFSRREYWGRWPFPSPGGLPTQGSEPGSQALQEDSSPSEPPGKVLPKGDHIVCVCVCVCVCVFYLKEIT